MSNVIHVCFKTRRVKVKVLTKGQMNKISKRITEIEQAMDLCDPDRDSDVLDNLEIELNEIVEVLKASVDQLMAG